MKKVLFVVDERQLGGVSIVLENILKNISNKKFDISVLVLHNNGNRLENLSSDVKIIYGTSYFDVIDLDFSHLLKTGKIFKAMKKAYIAMLMKTGKIEGYIKCARNKMNLDKYDIEISFKAGFCSLFVVCGDSRYKINWVHEDYKTYNKTKKYEKLFKKVFRAFDKHVVVSEQAAKSFNDIYDLCDSTQVIENHIDVEGVKIKSNDEIKLDIDTKKTNVVTLGRFCTEKGFDRLIDAVNLLKEENINKIDNLCVYILGYGSDEIDLNNRIKLYNLEEQIKIINTNMLDNNPYAFMKKCDLYIMPSRSESFGMVRIEALALGLPVITTNVANTQKMINDKIGIIVENSTKGIYNGLKQVLENKENLNCLKDNVSNYSYDNENKRIIKEIENLLEENCG